MADEFSNELKYSEGTGKPIEMVGIDVPEGRVGWFDGEGNGGVLSEEDSAKWTAEQEAKGEHALT